MRVKNKHFTRLHIILCLKHQPVLLLPLRTFVSWLVLIWGALGVDCKTIWSWSKTIRMQVLVLWAHSVCDNRFNQCHNLPLSCCVHHHCLHGDKRKADWGCVVIIGTGDQRHYETFTAQTQKKIQNSWIVTKKNDYIVVKATSHAMTSRVILTQFSFILHSVS